MKTLTLSLKKQWFDKIKDGTKKEEYRECSDHWIRRFVKDFKTMSRFRFEMCFRDGAFLTKYNLRSPNTKKTTRIIASRLFYLAISS
jgi:hypothetical protein